MRALQRSPSRPLSGWRLPPVTAPPLRAGWVGLGFLRQPGAHGSGVAFSTCCAIWNSSYVPTCHRCGRSYAARTRSQVPLRYRGFITGLRFYKSAANTGTHTGHSRTRRNAVGVRHVHRRDGLRLAAGRFSERSRDRRWNHLCHLVCGAGRPLFDGRSLLAAAAADNPPLHALKMASTVSTRFLARPAHFPHPRTVPATIGWTPSS